MLSNNSTSGSDSSKQTGRKTYLLIALAGQQNSGKSTIFNMLTGTNQYVANYPGVTVEKKSGRYKDGPVQVEVVDLPGAYSMTSFSLEEQVTRDFLMQDKPDCIINVIDASNLARSLMFTFQVMELNIPMVVGLNMMDVAGAHGIEIDPAALSEVLGLPVIPLVGRKKQGREELKEAVRRAAAEGLSKMRPAPDYGALESGVGQLEKRLGEGSKIASAYPVRWLAIKLLEEDEAAVRIVRENHAEAEAVLQRARELCRDIEEKTSLSASDHILAVRHEMAQRAAAMCAKQAERKGSTISERIDKVVLNRLLAPVFLVLTVLVIYQFSIVYGYKLTEYTWPYLASMRAFVASVLPPTGLVEDPLLTALVLWIVDSANTLLNYVPIFLILFSLIAIIEDSGYMARIAFILDRIFHRFGLHGQSTLPFILGGVFAGGCVVPGIMATKGIPDERARLATILTVPYMNCLAKIPLYTLLVNIFFAQDKAWAMFFISTVTMLIALIVSWLLTHTVLRKEPTAPFVMEMPTYHLPTVRGVSMRAFQRTWGYIRKVGTIVLAVSVCIFALLQFPNLPEEEMQGYQRSMEEALTGFQAKVSGTPHGATFAERANVIALMNYGARFNAARLIARPDEAEKVRERFEAENAVFYSFVKPGKKEPDARVVGAAAAELIQARKEMQRVLKEKRIVNSFFGRIGRALEPVTRFAGFDWKINVALISSFAARESSVATLGVLFQQGAEEGGTLESRMSAEKSSTGMTPLHALAVIVFFILYPPCLASTIMVKVQTGSYKWMLFSVLFPTSFGLAASSLLFSLGQAFSLDGVTMMQGFYVAAVVAVLLLGMVKPPRNDTTAEGSVVMASSAERG
jgi:ferrous iron transport protein B